MATQKGTESLAKELLERIHLASSLKDISDILEELAQDKGFKDHTNSIVTDPALTEHQVLSQLGYVIRQIEEPVLYSFFSDMLDKKLLWLFSSQRVDYFDQFVQAFQKATELTEVVELTVACELPENELQRIVKELTKSFGIQVVLKVIVEPRILGGVNLRVENMVYDYTLRSRFQRFQREWLSLIKNTEKALGRNQVDEI